MIVDDELEIRELLASALALTGLQCNVCNAPEDALRRAAASAPRVLLTSLDLPGMGGLEFCRRFRALPGCGEAAVIVMTARSARPQLGEEIVRSIEAGADDYILKPFEVGEVVTRIRSWLRLAVPSGEAAGEAQRFAGELGRSEGRCRTVLEQAPDGIAVALPDGLVTETNPRFAEITGLPHESTLNRSLSDILGPLRKRPSGKDLTGGPGSPSTEELTLVRPDGEHVHVEINSRVLSDGRLLAILRDVTGRRHEEEAYRRLVDASAQGLLVLQDDRAVFANPAMAELTGLEVTDLVAMTAEGLAALVHPDDREGFSRLTRNESPRQLPPGRMEFQIMHADGSYRLVEALTSATEFRGRPAVHATLVDISERKKALEQLRQSEQRFRALFDGANDGVLLVDPVSRQLETGNRRMREMLGYGDEELRGMRFDDLPPPEAASGVVRDFASHACGERQLAVNCPVRRKDGSVFYADVSTSLVRLQDQPRLMMVFRDVTGRQQAQKQQEEYAQHLEEEVAERTRRIRASEERYRALFENSDHAVIVTNLLGQATDCNPAAERLLGTARGALRGKHVAGTYLAKSWPTAADELIPEVLRAGTASRECTLHTPGDRTVPAQISLSALRGDDGSPEGLIWIVSDLSEREKLAEAAGRAREYAARVLLSLGSCGELVGRSPAFRRVTAFVSDAAPVTVPVLLQGESGTGKEAAARAIHAQGPRAEGPFVVFDCAALKGSLMESELFGHEKGSFTGAHRTKRGMVEIAEGGVLFLDEIGELPVELQSRLLRVIERGEYRRVGSVRESRADIRVIAATNRDLAVEIRRGAFRSDLFFRLNVLSFTVPPLRERPDDIPLLAEHFLAAARSSAGGRKRFRQDTLRLMTAYAWPGNVRELSNAVERAVILSGSDPVLKPSSLPPEVRAAAAGAPGDPAAALVRTIAEIEREAIAAALRATGGDCARAGSMLGIPPAALRRRARLYGLSASVIRKRRTGLEGRVGR